MIVTVTRSPGIGGPSTLFTGSVGAVLPREHRDRQRFAYWLAAPGFIATWALGFSLVYVTRISLFAAWILGALALSFVSLQGVLFVAAKDGRRGVGAAVVVVFPLVATVGLMVWRP